MSKFGQRMLDENKIPYVRKISKWIGSSNYQRWAHLLEFIESNYPGIFAPDWLFGGKKHGWGLCFKKSKSFCTLIPERNRLVIEIVPGGAERLDHRGCFLNSSRMGFEIIRQVHSPQVKLLYDIYHMSMMGEDVMAEIESNLNLIGYFHVADVPGRHQPGTGKIAYRAIADWLKRARFRGFIGMEFFPHGPAEIAARAAKEIFL